MRVSGLDPRKIKLNIYFHIFIIGGEKLQTTQLSGGTMLILGIIIAIVIVFIPAFIYIYAWIAAILLIIGGLVSILTGGG